MKRVYNFYAGPCTLPLEVMEEAQRDFLDYANTGMGVIEISHRSKEFLDIAETSEALLREILDIPDNYRILFEQGGGRGQFAALPLNLLKEDGVCDYFVTGHWSNCAQKECNERYGHGVVHECTFLNDKGRYEVDFSRMRVTEGSAYAYTCLNETVNGIETAGNLPNTGEVPLVADMSSDILTRPIDVRKFGVIFFGLQKNVGPAGMTVTIIRDDLIGHARKYTPSVLDYSILSKHGSMFNTPCTFAWYMAYLNFKWIKSIGGVQELERRNIKKSDLFYNYVDKSDFYVCKIEKNSRSRVNCVFTLKDESLNDEFLKNAKEQGLVGLKGHKVLGGMRASMYNAMPYEGAVALVDFMQDFAKKHA